MAKRLKNPRIVITPEDVIDDTPTEAVSVWMRCPDGSYIGEDDFEWALEVTEPRENTPVEEMTGLPLEVLRRMYGVISEHA